MGLYLGVEGVDGVGKSSVVNLAAEFLEIHGLEVTTVREPSTDIGREALEWDDPHLQALAFTLDRMLTLKRLDFETVDVVLSDRTFLSTLAYQSALGADIRWLLELQRPVPKPDVVYVIDREPLTEDATFEKEFLERVRNSYWEAARLVEEEFDVEIKWIEAEGMDKEEIAELIVADARRRLDDPLEIPDDLLEG
ncbi:dTMP kinase [Methanopyrus sp.]